MWLGRKAWNPQKNYQRQRVTHRLSLEEAVARLCFGFFASSSEWPHRGVTWTVAAGAKAVSFMQSWQSLVLNARYSNNRNKLANKRIIHDGRALHDCGLSYGWLRDFLGRAYSSMKNKADLQDTGKWPLKSGLFFLCETMLFKAFPLT